MEYATSRVLEVVAGRICNQNRTIRRSVAELPINWKRVTITARALWLALGHACHEGIENARGDCLFFEKTPPLKSGENQTRKQFLGNLRGKFVIPKLWGEGGFRFLFHSCCSSSPFPPPPSFFFSFFFSFGGQFQKIFSRRYCKDSPFICNER